MKKIEVLEQIKLATLAIESFFSGVTPEVKVEAESIVFESVKIKDSEQSISYPELVVGAEVLISSGEGSEPATDGEYELEGGLKLTVKDGLLESFISPEDAPAEVELAEEKEEEKEELPAEEVVEDAPADLPAEEEKEEEKLEEEVPSEVDALKAEIAELKAFVGQLAEAVAGLASKEDVAEFSTQITVLNDALNVVINTPAEFSKTDKSFKNKEDKQSKLNRMADLSSQMKK